MISQGSRHRICITLAIFCALVLYTAASAAGPVNLTEDAEKAKKECQKNGGRWIAHIEQTGSGTKDRVDCGPRYPIPESMMPNKYCYTTASGGQDCVDEKWIENRFKDFQREVGANPSPERAERWWKDVAQDEPILSRLREDFPRELHWNPMEPAIVQQFGDTEQRRTEDFGERLAKIGGIEGGENNRRLNGFFRLGEALGGGMQNVDANDAFVTARAEAFARSAAAARDEARLRDLAETWAVWYGRSSSETFGQYQERVNAAQREVESNVVTRSLASAMLFIRNLFR